MDEYRVKVKTFVNEIDDTVNLFLADIPAENIIAINTNVYGNQESSDEWKVVIYKKRIN